MARVIRRPAAEQDLEETAANRFLDAAKRTFEALALMPGMGGVYPLSNPQLQGLNWFGGFATLSSSICHSTTGSR